MRVADLQKFVRNQAELLTQAGAKGVAGDFERVAAALQPFLEASVAQFADFLVKAETFARTGVVSASGKGARKPAAAAVDSGEKIRAAGQRIAALYERAVDPAFSYAAIDQEVQAVGKNLTKGEALVLAREAGVVQTVKTRKAALELIARMISQRKENHERIQFRPAPATPAR